MAEALKPKEWLAICLGLVLVFALITPSLDSIKIFLLQRGYTALSEEPKEKLVQFATDMAKAPVILLRQTITFLLYVLISPTLIGHFWLKIENRF